MKYYLVTTNHFSEKLLFTDDEDYKAGMNFTPLAARSIDVLVLAFILMSTHMHYVLRCNNTDEAQAVITKLKLLYGGYFGKKIRPENIFETPQGRYSGTGHRR